MKKKRTIAEILPLSNNRMAWMLRFLVATMVFLACLAMAVQSGLNTVASRWITTGQGQLTVEVAPLPDETADSHAARVKKVMTAIEGTSGVRDMRKISSEEQNRLIAPWIDAELATALPLPTLIDVQTDPAVNLTAKALAGNIERTVRDIRVDDNSSWLRQLAHIATTIRLLALVVVILICAALVLAIIFICRSALNLHQQTIELLHTLGATDHFIARQFQRYAWRLVMPGSLAGCAACLIAIGIMIWLVSHLDVPVMAYATTGWRSILAPGFAMLAVPLLACTIALSAAQITVIRGLRTMS